MTAQQKVYAEIALTKGQITIVDFEDYKWFVQFKWRALWNRPTQSFYAVRSSPRLGGKGHTILMHREILGLKFGDRNEADHRDPSQTLDNRKNNLRVCTHSQNQMNSKKKPNNTSGFKGVSFESRTKKWRVMIGFNGRKLWIGRYATVQEAHAHYVAAAVRYFGEFARA